MIRSPLLASLCFITGATAASAQEGGYEDPIFSAEALRADFADLHTGMEAAHYDLYAATPRSVFDQRRAEMMAALTTPMTRSEAQLYFQTYLALARHGHARIDFPVTAWSHWREQGGGAFPVSIRIRDGRVLVESHQSGLSTLEPGAEILAMNGEPNAIWMERLSRYISAETPTLSHTLLEMYLPALIWVTYPDAEALDIRVRHTDGTLDTLRIPLLSRSEMDAMAEAGLETFSLDGFEARMISEDIAYLRPGPFYNTTPGENIWDETGYVAEIDRAFEGFLEADAHSLILDLRDNPGGTNSFSDPIIAWFADEPFSFASGFSIRISEASTAANAARLESLPEGQGGVSADFAALYASRENGETVLFEIPVTEPRTGPRFEGQVYALINRYSYSNATTVAALIQDYDFGTVIGETTSDMSTTYGAMESFTLPETGITVGFPKAHIIRPNGARHSHPVSPDIELDLPALRGTQDIALDQLVALIESRD